MKTWDHVREKSELPRVSTLQEHPGNHRPELAPCSALVLTNTSTYTFIDRGNRTNQGWMDPQDQKASRGPHLFANLHASTS